MDVSKVSVDRPPRSALADEPLAEAGWACFSACEYGTDNLSTIFYDKITNGVCIHLTDLRGVFEWRRHKRVCLPKGVSTAGPCTGCLRAQSVTHHWIGRSRALTLPGRRNANRSEERHSSVSKSFESGRASTPLTTPQGVRQYFGALWRNSRIFLPDFFGPGRIPRQPDRKVLRVALESYWQAKHREVSRPVTRFETVENLRLAMFPDITVDCHH